MKKIAAFVCIAAAAMLGACSTEKNKPTPTGGESQPTGEGLYAPAVRIATISYADGTAREVWNWDGNRLLSVTMEGEDYDDADIVFAYRSDGRVGSVSTEMLGENVDISFSYGSADGLVHAASVAMQGSNMAQAAVQHSADEHVKHVDVTLSDAMLEWLTEGLTDALLGGFGEWGDEEEPVYEAAHPASKLEYTSHEMTVDLGWTGDNATRMVTNIKLSFSVRPSELPEEMLDAMLGGMGEMAQVILRFLGDTPIPVQLAICDTTDYTFDSKPNPLKGYMGRIDMSALSKNNITGSVEHGTMTFTATLQAGSFGSFPYTREMPLPGDETSLSYTYNAAGYPLVVTDADDNTTTYTYKE